MNAERPASPLIAFAQFISIVLHPLFMPVYTLALALWCDPRFGYFLDLRARMILLAMVALMTVAFPLTSALLLIRTGMLSGLQMPNRRERIAPYCMTLVYYAMTWFLLARSPLDPIVLALISGAILALLLTTIITLWWKISAHMVGVGGVVGALVAMDLVHGLNLMLPISATILVAGAVGTARLLVSDHTAAQAYSGFLVGAVCTACGLFFPLAPLM